MDIIKINPSKVSKARTAHVLTSLAFSVRWTPMDSSREKLLTKQDTW